MPVTAALALPPVVSWNLRLVTQCLLARKLVTEHRRNTMLEPPPMRILPTALACAIALLAVPEAAAQKPSSAAAGIRLHRHVATERGYVANAYWLESAQGIVLIDTLFLNSDVDLLIAELRSRDKPVAGILYTHPHYDHTGGAARIRAAFGDVPVLATAATAAEVLPVFERAQREGNERRYGDDFPTSVVVPDRVVASGETVELAGMHFRFTDLGAMEAANNSTIENLETMTLFTGDATVMGALYYVGEGHSCQALAALEKLRAEHPADRLVYSGHYEAMRLGAVVDTDLRQLRYLRQTMAAALADPGNRSASGELNEATRDRLTKQVAAELSGYADYGLGPELMAGGVNLPGLEREMRKELASGQRCND